MLQLSVRVGILSVDNDGTVSEVESSVWGRVQ